jgi:Flp pilus assembly pilin Flp
MTSLVQLAQGFLPALRGLVHREQGQDAMEYAVVAAVVVVVVAGAIGTFTGAITGAIGAAFTLINTTISGLA